MASAPGQGPFSHPNRVRLIDAYFAERKVDPATAWKDIYRLLLWVDNRTGVAHCYEADKSQPGRPWYPRSLIFHDWVARELGVDPLHLKDEIDYMFRSVIGDVTAAEADEMLGSALAVQINLFDEGYEMPVPGDDPRLHDIVVPLMPRDAAERPDDDTVSEVLRQVYAHMSSENKRANLLGRGFEDVLYGVLRRLQTPPPHFDTQTPLETIPGFRPARTGDKVEKVDLWVGDGDQRRVLVTAKWSIRADREKQLASDFTIYDRANELRHPFEYVWITNEFDPARLVANATNSQNNRYILDSVVHICPDALRLVHKLDEPNGTLGKNPAQLRELLTEGRIIGLDDWLRSLPAAPAMTAP